MAVRTWDFTLAFNDQQVEDLCTWLAGHCSKLCFQKETSETGYVHYQGRLRLHNKVTLSGLLELTSGKVISGSHWSITSHESTRAFSYVQKEQTRVGGPWSDKEWEPKTELPWQLEVKELYPWQRAIRENVTRQQRRETFDSRTINVLISPEGNQGRSTIAGILEHEKLTHTIPALDDHKALLQFVCSFPPRTGYIIDMPRSLDQRKLTAFYAAIETIKNGVRMETRYKGFKEHVNSPAVWIFTNTYPNPQRLSKDRWKLWEIYLGELRSVTLEE